jgi:hypothetical protein
MQTIEETLFANRKTKEKNARSNYPRTPLIENYPPGSGADRNRNILVYNISKRQFLPLSW